MGKKGNKARAKAEEDREADSDEASPKAEEPKAEEPRAPAPEEKAVGAWGEEDSDEDASPKEKKGKKEKKEKKEKKSKKEFVMEDEDDDDEEDERKNKKGKKEKKEKSEKKDKSKKKEEEEEEEDEEDDEEDDDEPAQPPPPTVPADYPPYYREILEKAPFVAHNKYPEMKAPILVSYCGVCGLPPDFCAYGPTWSKCKPWIMENCPFYYPDLAGASLEDAQKTAQAAKDKEKIKEKPGGKKTRAKSPEVNIKRLARGGRKCVTHVIGLEGFGVNLADAAKNFKKKFACGSAVVKGEAGIPDLVEIQGDFEEEAIDLICEKYKEVPREKCIVGEGGVKKGGKKK